MGEAIPAVLRVATAQGPGAGRFLAAALLDAVDGGAPLRAIVASAAGIDFVFGGDDDLSEVIRAVLDASGDVVSAELLRAATTPGGGAIGLDELAAALRRGREITHMQLGEPTCVTVTMDDARSYRVPLR